MSITVLSGSPQAATPVYNKMLYKVSGSLIAQPNFRYVCDVKNPAGTTLARLKCDKLPTTNFGFFDVQKVVETLVSPTKPSLTQTGFVDHSGFYSGYRLDFTQEYGSTPVVTGATTTVSGVMAFAGNLEQLELADWSGNLYFPAGGFTDAVTRSLATNVRRTVYADSYGWLCQGVGSGITSPEDTVATVTYYTAGGASVRTYDVSIVSASGSTIFRFGAGPMNIKSLTSGQCQDGLAGSVNFPTAEGAYYTIIFADAGGNGTVPFTYVIGPCQRFNSIPVHFVNKYGGIDSYTFTMKNRKRANIEREVFG